MKKLKCNSKTKKKLLSTFNFQLSANSGFTLLELMLSITIIGIILGFSIPIYSSFQTRNNLDVASNTITQTLRRAQVLSQSVEGDISWGVNISNNNITLFRGIDFSGRDTDFDEVFEIPSITVSGLQGVVFSKFSGYPQTNGTIILTSVADEVRQITINEKGTIDY